MLDRFVLVRGISSSLSVILALEYCVDQQNVLNLDKLSGRAVIGCSWGSKNVMISQENIHTDTEIENRGLLPLSSPIENEVRFGKSIIAPEEHRLHILIHRVFN